MQGSIRLGFGSGPLISVLATFLSIRWR